MNSDIQPPGQESNPPLADIDDGTTPASGGSARSEARDAGQETEPEPWVIKLPGATRTSSHFPPGSTSPTSSTERIADRTNRAPNAGFFTWMYGVAATVGVLLAFLSHQAWFLPLIVFFVYTIAAYKPAVATGTVFEFADSVYYLGFTLTIASLLASLEPFSPVGLPNPEKVFHYFGLGMLTTLVGVIARTMLQTFHRLPAETLEEVNQRLTAEARRYIEQLSALNDSVGRTVTRTVSTFEQSVVPGLAMLRETIGTTTTHLKDTATVTGSLRERAHDAFDALDTLVSRYTETTRRVRRSQRSLVSAANSLAATLHETASSTGAASLTVTGDFQKLAEGAASAGEALGGFAHKVERVNIDPAPLVEPLKTVGNAVRDAAAIAQTDVAVLREAIAAFQDQISELNRTAAALAKPTLSQGLAQLRSELESLAQATADHRRTTASQIDAQREQLQAGLTAARDFSAALDELANITLGRLDKVLPAETPTGLSA